MAQVRRKPQRRKPGVTPDAIETGEDRLALPQRLAFALSLVSPATGAAKRWTEARDLIMERWGIGERQAALDIRRAYLAIQERVNADMPTLAARVRDRLEAVALAAEEHGDWAAAAGALHKLGKLSGMEEGASEDSLVKKLSDAALEAAIRQAVAERVERLSDAEFEDLAKRRAARAGQDGDPGSAGGGEEP